MRTVLFASASILLFSLTLVGQNAPVQCSGVTVVGPDKMIRAGEEMVFTTKLVGDKAPSPIKYHWTIDGGTIKSGQGTATLVVQTTKEDAARNITATVQIAPCGPLDYTVSSASGAVLPEFCTKPLTEYGKIRWLDEMAQLDGLLIQLNSDLDTVGSVYIQLERRETMEDTKKHILKIVKHFRSRDKDFDVGRLMLLVQEGRDHHITILNLHLPTGDLPKCDNNKDCSLFSGKDFLP